MKPSDQVSFSMNDLEIIFAVYSQAVDRNIIAILSVEDNLLKYSCIATVCADR